MDKLRHKLLLVLLGASFSLVIIEGLLFILGIPRFYKRHSSPPQFAVIEKAGGEFVYYNIPLQRIRFVYDGNPRGYFGKENEVDHITNSWGFRGQEFSLLKPRDTFRIAFLGDSYTFGEGVRFADTYPELVSTILAQKYKGSSIKFESYNFGVGGYNAQDALSLLKDIALKAAPELVVLKYDVADAEPRLFKVDSATGALVRSPRWYEDAAYTNNLLPPDKLIYKLRLARLFWQIGRDKRQSDKMLAYYQGLFKTGNSSWPESRIALAEIFRLCQQQDIPCYVVCFPVLHQLNAMYPFAKVHSLIGKEVRDKGALFIDLFFNLKGMEARNLWVHPTDQHPNEKVHRIAAEAIVANILSDKYLQDKINHLAVKTN